MGWNEPGNNDPWSSGGSNGGSNGGGRRPNGGQDGPPDLDEALRKLQAQLSAMFGGGGNKGGAAGSGGTPGFGGIIALVLLLVIGAAAVSSVHIVEPAERGVVTRFGRYVDTLPPGLAIRLPFPIESVTSVDVEQVRRLDYAGTMLTKDENIVDIKLALQYRVGDPFNYLFAVENPENTIQEATASAFREVVGQNTMDFVIKDGRSEIAARAKELLQEILDGYKTGLLVSGVNLANAQAPAPVQAAFEDANKAREDGERLKNEGEAYSNDVIPKARGRAARVLEEANAYMASLIAKAEGDSERFTKLLTEYKKAPAITRDRLYIETMERVYADTSKVIIDTDEGSNPLMYVPLDKLMQGKVETAPNVLQEAVSGRSASPRTPSSERSRFRDVRSRESR